MKELKLLENELVPVYITSTGEKVVYGTELHAVLEVKIAYKDWSVRRFNECDAIENVDFEAAQICAPSGQAKKEHIIKLDTAKEMAMLEHNEKGKQVQKYFIQVEKEYKQEKEIKRKHLPFTLKEAEKLVREGERVEGRGFVKTEGFDKTVVFLMSLAETIWQITQKHKSFRMELFYDAETLNTNYCFFTPATDKCELNDTQQVSQKD